VINDDIELALELEPDGVHLGKDDIRCKEARRRLGEQMLIGVSCYNDPERAGRAVADGADYIAFGAMYPTASKLNATEASPGLIRTAKQQYTIPVVAIGGITPDNCLPVIEAGADLLAVISGVYLADAPGAVIDRFNTLMLKR
jgi:thiamine-phosphate pyrophosphorylase